MKYLVFVEKSDSGKIKDIVFQILENVPLNGTIDLAFIGADINSPDMLHLKELGIGELFIIEDDGTEKYNPEIYKSALSKLISTNLYDYIIGGATSLGKDLFPRIAAHFKAGMASDAIGFCEINGEITVTRPLFAGKCLSDLTFLTKHPRFITIRPNSLQSSGQKRKKEQEFKITRIPADKQKSLINVKSVIRGVSEKIDLTEANIIVSGGRAMKNSENFKILEDLAESIGATVGASRAAVDSGYAPHSMQVGQTGKTVSPTLYIACGISGAIQHLAGMRTSKYILAINTDPSAPIFNIADYGIVGDLFKIVPILTEEFKILLSSSK